ncbi:DUF5368 family protein [Pelagibacterium limicola]|uniref:DUF5368 family protein n=1 Tax=Pelagibacterium limicola TaxID=2791022 RepID=UPI0018AFEB58|nr:DUF5368 family protein [Pelagibacterium limicola]
MSDFSPVVVFYILSESLGIWLWIVLALALALLVGITYAALRLRAADRSPARPLVMAAIAGVLTTAIFTFLVPGWSHAEISALNGPVDYVFAILFSMVPAGIVAALVFIIAGLRCASGMARTSKNLVGAIKG